MQELDTKNLDKELWVAEYNFGTKQFHHSFLKNSISTNKDIIQRLIELKDEKEIEEHVFTSAWIPFSIGTCDETSEAIINMRGRMVESGYYSI